MARATGIVLHKDDTGRDADGVRSDCHALTTARGGEDRYPLSNAEGVFAFASRSAIEQKVPEVRDVFTDHLGSTDVITDETGSVEQERQSYDAFGARRNAAWGKPMLRNEEARKAPGGGA